MLNPLTNSQDIQTQQGKCNAHQQLRVLIADDSTLIRDRLSARLAGYTGIKVVGQAQDASETMESIRRLQPDAIILDWRMPGGGGLRVLQEIQREALQAAVIVFTNNADEQYRHKATAAGAHYVLDKYSEFGSIKEVLLTILSGLTAATEGACGCGCQTNL